MDPLCFVSAMLSCPFIADLWSPVGKGRNSWLSVCEVSCVLATFPCGVLGQLWYLIASIPDLCLLSNFNADIVIACVTTFFTLLML